MLRSAAITRIQRGLGFRSDQSDNIVSALQEAQRLLEKGRSLPFFLLQEGQTLTFTSGSAEIALPTGFIREKSGEHPYALDDTGVPVFLEKLTFEEGTMRFVSETITARKPVAYTLRTSTIKSWPPERDASYDFTWSYYKAADVLSSDVENAWLASAPEALIGRAGMILATDLRNKSALDLFKGMYAEAWSGAFAEGVLREDEGDEIIVGGRL